MTRTKQIAFHNKYERATLKSQKQEETLGEAILETILGFILCFAVSLALIQLI